MSLLVTSLLPTPRELGQQPRSVGHDDQSWDFEATPPAGWRRLGYQVGDRHESKTRLISWSALYATLGFMTISVIRAGVTISETQSYDHYKLEWPMHPAVPQPAKLYDSEGNPFSSSLRYHETTVYSTYHYAGRLRMPSYQSIDVYALYRQMTPTELLFAE